MSSNKRRRDTSTREPPPFDRLRLPDKLEKLVDALKEEAFPLEDVYQWIKIIQPIYERWLNPVKITEFDHRVKVNQGLVTVDTAGQQGDVGTITNSLKMMDEDAVIIRQLIKEFQSLYEYVANSDADLRFRTITRNILQVIWFTRMNLFSYLRVLNLSCVDVPSFNDETNKDSRDNVYWFDVRSQDQVQVEKREKLILHLLFHFNLKGYRKVEGDPEYVYTQRVVAVDGGEMYNTYTYERFMTVRNAIYDLCRKEEQTELWNIVISDKEVTNAEIYLKNCIDEEFPLVKYQRRKYSFQDGIYDGDTDEFCLYRDGVLKVFPDLDRIGSFMYIEQTFMPAYTSPIHNIMCPNFESIMKMQCWGDKCIEMMYIMFGRCLHYVGEKDNWQVMMYLIGEAGTGKSTIIDTLQKFIPSPLVGSFGSGGESQFGQQDWDKMALIIFPEVKPSEFKKSMPLGKWFSLVAGDAVCLAAKFKAPKYVSKFPVHIVAAGNEYPDWNDANGAWRRRTVSFPFRVKLRERNPNLPKLIDREIPFILRKSLLAYYRAVEQFEGKDLWSMDQTGEPIMPKEIREESCRMQKSTTPMLDFLLDREFVELDCECEVTREEFIKVFESFVRTVRHSYPQRWSEDLYSHAFQELGITVTTSEDGDVIRGLRLKKNAA
jgi:hypothetical protein